MFISFRLAGFLLLDSFLLILKRLEIAGSKLIFNDMIVWKFAGFECGIPWFLTLLFFLNIQDVWEENFTVCSVVHRFAKVDLVRVRGTATSTLAAGSATVRSPIQLQLVLNKIDD